jgi:transcriptional regulator with XRE-family HTH domain
MTPHHKKTRGQSLSNVLKSPHHESLRKFLKIKRQELEITQEQLAARIKRRQSFVSDVENGWHRVSVVEYLEFAAALGFDPADGIKQILKRR